MKYGLFFAKRGQCWRDSWSYGPWEQWICNRAGPDGPTQCARAAIFPFYFSVAAICTLLVMILMGLFFPSGEIRWGRWALATSLSTTWLLIHGTWLWMGYSLMVAVGPMNDGTRRVCPWDEAK